MRRRLSLLAIPASAHDLDAHSVYVVYSSRNGVAQKAFEKYKYKRPGVGTVVTNAVP